MDTNKEAITEPNNLITRIEVTAPTMEGEKLQAVYNILKRVANANMPDQIRAALKEAWSKINQGEPDEPYSTQEMAESLSQWVLEHYDPDKAYKGKQKYAYYLTTRASWQANRDEPINVLSWHTSFEAAVAGRIRYSDHDVLIVGPDGEAWQPVPMTAQPVSTYAEWQRCYKTQQEFHKALVLAWFEQQPANLDIKPLVDDTASDVITLTYVDESNQIKTHLWEVDYDLPDLFVQLGWHNTQPPKKVSLWYKRGPKFREVDHLNDRLLEIGAEAYLSNGYSSEVRDLAGTLTARAGTRGIIIGLREYQHFDAVVIETQDAIYVVEAPYVTQFSEV